MVVLEVDVGELSFYLGFFLRIFCSGVLVADGGVEVDSSDGGVAVACWGNRGSFHFFVGVHGVGDCADCRGGGGGIILCEFVDGVDG